MENGERRNGKTCRRICMKDPYCPWTSSFIIAVKGQPRGFTQLAITLLVVATTKKQFEICSRLVCLPQHELSAKKLSLTGQSVDSVPRSSLKNVINDTTQRREMMIIENVESETILVQNILGVNIIKLWFRPEILLYLLFSVVGNKERGRGNVILHWLSRTYVSAVSRDTRDFNYEL